MKTFNNIDFSIYKQEFLEKLGNINTWPEIPGVCGPGYPNNSIFMSEALVIYTLCKEFNIDLLLESGVFRGGSTRIWSNILYDIDIKCVDILEEPKHHKIVHRVIDSLKEQTNIEFHIGDGIQLLPEIIKNNKDKKIGVFVDGPKDNVGKSLCEKTLTYDNVYFACLHDYTDLCNEHEFSTASDPNFQSNNSDLDINHPQKSTYPQGPGLWCKIKK